MLASSAARTAPPRKNKADKLVTLDDVDDHGKENGARDVYPPVQILLQSQATRPNTTSTRQKAMHVLLSPARPKTSLLQLMAHTRLAAIARGAMTRRLMHSDRVQQHVSTVKVGCPCEDIIIAFDNYHRRASR